MPHLKEAAASRIITTYCRKLQNRAFADDFNKKLKAGITAKVEYYAFEVCNALLYKQVYAAFKKKFPDISDIAFGVTKTHIYVKQTNKNKTVDYYAIENTKRKLFEEVTEDCKKPKKGGSPTSFRLSSNQVLDILDRYCEISWGHGTETMGRNDFIQKLNAEFGKPKFDDPEFKNRKLKVDSPELKGYQNFSLCSELKHAMSEKYPEIQTINIALTESHVLVKLKTFSAPKYYIMKHGGKRVYDDIMAKNPPGSFHSCDKKAKPWFLRWLPF
jgi:hypothetical protein